MSTRSEHEKLKVYERALERATILDDVARQIPDGRGDLRDQLRRASTSIVLNIAEGAGEFSPPDKARFYRMARRSASECAAIVDLLEKTKGLRSEPIEVRSGIAQVGSMLTAMVKAVESRRR